jgi:hypothetical protein
LQRQADNHGSLAAAEKSAERNKREELIGKITAAYAARGQEAPLIPRSSTIEGLKKMLAVAQKRG